MYDIERLVGRVSYGNVNARDLIQLKHSISEIPNIKALLNSMNQNTLVQVNQLEPLDDLLDILEQSLVEEPPISVKDGGLFKVGFNTQLDEYLEASKKRKNMVSRITSQRKTTYRNKIIENKL